MWMECEVEGGGQVNAGIFILVRPFSFELRFIFGLVCGCRGFVLYTRRGHSCNPFLFPTPIISVVNQFFSLFFLIFLPGVVVLVQTSTSLK